MLGGYNAATGLRLKDPALRVLISIQPNPHHSSVIQRNANLSSDFPLRESILKFLEEYRFDGVELDWPTAAQDWSQFKTLLKLISVPLAKEGYTLAVALNPEDPVDPELVSIVDLIILKSWRDVQPACPSCEKTEHPILHPGPLSFIVQNASKWVEQIGGEQRLKIVLAIPIFSQGYTLKFGNLTKVGAPTQKFGKQNAYTKRRDGKLAYYEVKYHINRTQNIRINQLRDVRSL